MIRKFFTLIGTVGIAVAFIALIALMGAMRPKLKPQAPVINPPTLFFETAQARPVTLDVVAQGEVRPRTDITLTTQVAGKVVRVSDLFVDGGAFRKDDLLVKLEDADLRAAAANARARVAQAEEALRREEAESALASRDYKDLGRTEAPSDLTLRKPQLEQARANFEAARADYEAAKLNVARTEIRAPFDGRVRQRLVGEGQFVGPGAQIASLFSTEVAEIRLLLTDADLAKLGTPFAFAETDENPGPIVRLVADVAGATHEWTGRIARTDGAFDPGTRQIAAIAVVDDPYGAGADDGTPLAAGLFVTAIIEGRSYGSAFVAPRAALYGRDKVYIVDADDTVRERTVRVINADRDTITIADGLKSGDRLIVSPLRGAGEGDKVAPIDRNAPTAPRQAAVPASAAKSADAVARDAGDTQ